MIKDYITPAERLNFKGQSWLQRRKLKRVLEIESSIGNQGLTIQAYHQITKTWRQEGSSRPFIW